MNVGILLLFWVILAILFYIYLGYPCFLFVLTVFKKSVKVNNQVKSVTIIIPARNEEKIIKSKLDNCLSLNYPENLLEILVVSDQSTDKTENIVTSFKNTHIHLISLTERHGKTAAQNMAVERAKGEIIVFSDANAMYDNDAMIHLTKHFENLNVGCVSGELCYHNPDKSVVGEEENFYWKYEKWIKRHEDQVGSILGANGSIYAVRKSEYIPLGHDIISDFIEPLLIASRGKKVVFEPLAKSYEIASDKFIQEFQRKRRIISRSLYGLMQYAWLLNPLKYTMLSFELYSHKLLRWLSSFFMIILFILNMFLIGYSKVLFLLFILQGLFYLIALLGFLVKDKIKLSPIFFAPYYFCMINYASFLGVIDYLKGQPAVFWEPIRK